MDEPQAILPGASLVFIGLWVWVVFGGQSADPFRDQQDAEGVGGDVHGPDGPWFGGAKCPRAEDDHEVDEDFSQFIRQFVELGLL